jgi:hypothetical protein
MDLANGVGGRSAGFASDGLKRIRVNSPGADEGAGFGSIDGAGVWTAETWGGAAIGV